MASTKVVEHLKENVLWKQAIMDRNANISDPPFEETYKNLFLKHNITPLTTTTTTTTTTATIEVRDLPLIDLSRLVATAAKERENCKRDIANASREWGFFQVVNHGIPHRMLEEMNKEQVKVFREPFNKKKGDNCMNLRLSPGSYRWGSPTPNCLSQLSWSEAFHIPMNDICSNAPRNIANGNPNISNLCSTVKQFATTVSELANKLANILVEKLGHDELTFIEEKCSPNTCYLRMNRYPPCPKYSHVLGLMPHTDSDFLTILYQDQVGGLQLVKDGRWISVKPNPEALIVNIGDLFQAWSNGVYKSVVHRVVANPRFERFSTAYFLCPSGDAVIQSYREPSMYRKFSFGEYRQQVQQDVREFGHKIGLSRFLICN
ncbi:gibberellin 2-beta-dioxygenase 8 isoform X1 [Spinacia oleracea]|uniref:Gibberellin 2-beta-dioxygenase 8 isoform X1 n=2 Tax=Spinacia oleracea TaxID=3562 RepID=A0A9R0IT56_SPIOL|nr:gibberellin 2-beta-dioxygenase 8 isoform X1 [Spinacia oleracea]XP_021854852.2 gibberellin 2-beta-dioxygenase 8 isoform X1 [Spinacia oleracea]